MVKAQKHSISVKKSARYFTLGNPGPHIRHVWVVMHGYGQLGDFFIRNFIPIHREDTLVIAPEGHSRFYLGEDTWQRVGASWMTKEERLDEIADQTRMLDAVWEEATIGFTGNSKGSGESKTVPPIVTVLGFSQGTSAAWRWMQRGKVEINNLIIWAGSIPEENMDQSLKKLQGKKVWAVFGDQDEYIPLEAGQKRIAKLKAAYPDLKHFVFNDSHRINEAALQKIATEIYDQ